MLQALEFIEPSDDAPSSIRIYDTTLRAWSKIPLGFVVDVRESKFVFIKHSDVHHCTGFDDILATTSSREVANIRTNLKHDRTYVRHPLKALDSGRLRSMSTSPGDNSNDSDHEHIAPANPVSKALTHCGNIGVRRMQAVALQRRCIGQLYAVESSSCTDRSLPLDKQTRDRHVSVDKVWSKLQ